MIQQLVPLHSELLKQLMKAARWSGRAIYTDLPAEEYDWHAPSHFLPEQLGSMRELASAAAKKMGQALGELLRAKVEFKVEPIKQQYLSQARAAMAESKNFHLLLNSGSQPAGVVSLPTDIGTGWVSKLLGGQEGSGERKLSSLEATLLNDVMARMTEAFSSAFQAAGMDAVKPAGAASQEQMELPGEDTAELCRFAFSIADGKTIWLSLRSSLLDKTVGAEAAKPQANVDYRALISSHLQLAPVRAEVWLGQASLTLGDVMSLAAGDVILLQKKTGDPADLVVQGQHVGTGLPASYNGNYALQILGLSQATGEDAKKK